MSRNRTVSVPHIQKAQLQVFTKQQFNYKRNNSNLMSTCLTWNLQDQEDDYIEESQYQQNCSQQLQDNIYDKADQHFGSGRNQQQQKNTQPHQSSAGVDKKKAKSAQNKNQAGKSVPKKDYSKYQKTSEQIQEDQLKASQRKQKIKDYIQSLIPFSRTLTDSKFQQLYRKAAPLAYGNANTSQPIGGVIYGNNLRSFNVNPHDYQNNPKTYQTYNTSLNFAHRMKRDQSKHWKRLEKQFGKKLNLHQKNHTLEEGKQVVYVDVNEANMFQTMRENLDFKKGHRQEIRDQQKNYEHQKQMKSKAERQKFYRNKAQKLQNNLNATRDETVVVDRDSSQRLRQQVIYKLHDKNGNVRVGADRHALTCFVDINFPQNDALYTQELKSRYQIYPTEVQNHHKNLDAHKRENYQKNLSSVYPSHYLVPNSEQPQIQKMLVQKSKQQTILKHKKRN